MENTKTSSMDSLFPSSSVPIIAELINTSRQGTKALETQLANSARELKMWEDLSMYIQRGWALHILALLEKENARLKQMRAENHSAIPALEETYAHAKEQGEKKHKQFPRLIEQAFAGIKPSLDRTSQHPRYNLADGFFKLAIDDQKRTARLTDNEGVLGEIPADVGAIVELVQKEYKRVFERPFNGKKFLEKLRHQYLAIVGKKQEQDGAVIPIRSITQRLGKNEKGFRTDEFLMDLSQIVTEGPIEINGWKLDLQQTKDISQGMLLHGLAGRGYIGFITFKKV